MATNNSINAPTTLLPLTTIGDIIVGGTSGAAIRVPIGTLGQVVTVGAANTLTYSTPSSGLGTFLTQTSANLPTNGINLGASNAVLGIGTTTVTSPITLLASNISVPTLDITVDNGSNNAVSSNRYRSYSGTGNTSNLLSYNAARGSLASPTATQSGDQLFAIAGNGYTGSAFGSSNGYVLARATQTFTGSANGTKLEFGVTPNGSTTVGTKFTVDQNGFAGIGTSTPAFPLDLYANSTNSYAARFVNDNTTGGNLGGVTCDIYTASGSMAGPQFIGRAARGGFSSPTAVQNGDVVGTFAVRPYDGGSFPNNITGGMTIASIQNQSAGNQGTNLKLYTTAFNTSTPQVGMYIDGNSWVGLCSGNQPSHPLQIIASGSDQGTYVDLDNGATNTGSTHYRKCYGGTSSGGQAVTYQAARGSRASPSATLNGDLLLAINATGYDGSGFGNQNAGFTCYSLQDWNGNGHGTYMLWQTTAFNQTNAVNSMSLDNDKGLQITLGGGSQALALNNSDIAFKTTTTLWSVASDVRIKTNIVDTEAALPLMMAIKPRKYTYTADHIAHMKDSNPGGYCAFDESTTFYGFIADELETVVPSCVTVSHMNSGNNLNLKSVNQHNLMVLSYKAIQELADQNIAMQATITALQAAVAALQSA